MINIQKCENCGAHNPLFLNNCKRCHAFLRDKVATLTMSKFLWDLVESPIQAFKTLIQSEQKNFVHLFLILISMKFAVLSMTFRSAITEETFPINNILVGGIISFFLSIAFIYLFSFAFKIIFSLIGAKVRFKDTLAVNTYALLPFAYSFILLFPIEIALFGMQWITYNPSPFIIKPGIAYGVWGLELVFLIWSLFLSFAGTYTHTGNRVLALLFGLMFVLLFFGFSLFTPFLF